MCHKLHNACSTPSSKRIVDSASRLTAGDSKSVFDALGPRVFFFLFFNARFSRTRTGRTHRCTARVTRATFRRQGTPPRLQTRSVHHRPRDVLNSIQLSLKISKIKFEEYSINASVARAGSILILVQGAGKKTCPDTIMVGRSTPPGPK